MLKIFIIARALTRSFNKENKKSDPPQAQGSKKKKQCSNLSGKKLQLQSQSQRKIQSPGPAISFISPRSPNRYTYLSDSPNLALSGS